PPAGLEHPARGQEALAVGGRQKIHLELGREHVLARLEQRQRRVAAGAVGNRGADAGMQVAVLLAQVGPERQLDVDLSRLDAAQARAERGHDRLFAKAVVYPLPRGLRGSGRVDVAVHSCLRAYRLTMLEK